MNTRYFNQDLLAGLLLIAVGAVGFFCTKESSSPAGFTENLFPSVVTLGVMAIGAVIALRGVMVGGERVSAIPLRSCAAVAAGVVAFALLIEKAGLAAAVVVTVMLSTLGFRGAPLRASLVFGLCMAAAMFVLFVGFLGQSIRLLPGF